MNFMTVRGRLIKRKRTCKEARPLPDGIPKSSWPALSDETSSSDLGCRGRPRQPPTERVCQALGVTTGRFVRRKSSRAGLSAETQELDQTAALTSSRGRGKRDDPNGLRAGRAVPIRRGLGVPHEAGSGATGG
jgi:hypothetical protein